MARPDRAAYSLHLTNVVEASDDANASKTLDGIILSWRRGAQQMHGGTAEARSD